MNKYTLIYEYSLIDQLTRKLMSIWHFFGFRNIAVYSVAIFISHGSLFTHRISISCLPAYALWSLIDFPVFFEGIEGISSIENGHNVEDLLSEAHESEMRCHEFHQKKSCLTTTIVIKSIKMHLSQESRACLCMFMCVYNCKLDENIIIWLLAHSFLSLARNNVELKG